MLKWGVKFLGKFMLNRAWQVIFDSVTLTNDIYMLTQESFDEGMDLEALRSSLAGICGVTFTDRELQEIIADKNRYEVARRFIDSDLKKYKIHTKDSLVNLGIELAVNYVKR